MAHRQHGRSAPVKSALAAPLPFAQIVHAPTSPLESGARFAVLSAEMRLLWLVPLSLLFWSGIAFADEKVAKQHFMNGQKAYLANDFARAASEFEEAVKESPRPELFFNLAR